MPQHAFLDELSRLGPDAPLAQGMPLEEAQRYCYQLARNHYENFTVVSWLLPKELGPHFCSLYAWCRWADDLADEMGDTNRSLKLLAWWESQLNQLYTTGQATHPVYVALRETIEKFDLPQRCFLDLMVAFRQDQWQTRYETHEDLIKYCQHSANPVGRLVLHLGGCHRADTARLSDSICTGLQLANFWQDVRRDYERGRIYIPKKDQAHFGFTEADFARKRATGPFMQLLAYEVKLARRFLEGGIPLVKLVPAPLSLPVQLFIDGGLAILAAIERQEYDVWSRRPTVGRLKKLGLVWNAWWNTGGT
ncbi:MAG TPA: squalene synthase HpnC [Pirellulaceae bacterium]|nr:squalene synthase HpnC [Pirellulaceae bacterium]